MNILARIEKVFWLSGNPSMSYDYKNTSKNPEYCHSTKVVIVQHDMTSAQKMLKKSAEYNTQNVSHKF